jgi:Fe-S cluster biogenesis protein NfuA
MRRVLDDEVSLVVMGDVVYGRSHDGVVEVCLRGAGSGCCGSSATLEHGIEARLREAIPEVQAAAAL